MVVRTVFVTGASGFVGTHVVEELLHRGCEVRCLIRPTADAGHLARPGIVRVAGTLEDPAGYRHALQGCDTVLHLAGAVAARSKAAMLRVNGRGTARLADACAAVESPPRLVAVSSLAAAGPPRPDRAYRDEEDPPAPVSIYGRSKRAGEIALERRAGRLPLTIVRPGIVFGARDRQGAAVFRAIQRTGLHVVVGFQTPRLSLIHVDDLVDLLLRAATDGETLPATPRADRPGRGIYLACDDREHPTYWQFGERVAGALGRRVFVWPLWRSVGCMVGGAADLVSRATGSVQLLSLDKVREAIAWSWACSAAKARSQLAFAPALPLDARLRQTADWFREYGWL
jgi:nucleoside-diphosphate-sugar epimerase